MALTTGQIPYVANLNTLGGVGVVAGTSNTVTLGSNTNGATICTAGAQGGRVFSLIASTDDTVASNIFVYIYRGTTVIPLGLVPVAASSGNVTGTRNIDFLNGANIPGLPVDSVGRPYIAMQGNDVLKCGALAGLTAAKSVWVSAQGANYQA